MSVTLPTHLADELEQRVTSGIYTSHSGVVTDGLWELFAREEVVNAWLRGNMASAHDELRADPLSALSASQAHAHIAARHSRRTSKA